MKIQNLGKLIGIGVFALVMTGCGGGSSSGDSGDNPSVPDTPTYSALPLGEYKISLPYQTKLIISGGCAKTSVYDDQGKYYSFTFDSDEILPAGNYDVTFSQRKGYSQAKSNLYHHSFNVELLDLPVNQKIEFGVAGRVLYKLTVAELDEYILNYKNIFMKIYDANYNAVTEVGNLNGSEQIQLTAGTYYVNIGPYSCKYSSNFTFNKI